MFAHVRARVGLTSKTLTKIWAGFMVEVMAAAVIVVVMVVEVVEVSQFSACNSPCD